MVGGKKMDRVLNERLDRIDASLHNFYESAEMSYKQLVGSLDTASQIFFTPIGGVINHVTVSWPRGCNFKVEVVFRHKTVQFIPTPDTGGSGIKGIALDNFTETLAPSWEVRKNDPIEMHLINHDNAFEHTISAVVHICGEEIKR